VVRGNSGDSANRVDYRHSCEVGQPNGSLADCVFRSGRGLTHLVFASRFTVGAPLRDRLVRSLVATGAIFCKRSGRNRTRDSGAAAEMFGPIVRPEHNSRSVLAGPLRSGVETRVLIESTGPPAALFRADLLWRPSPYRRCSAGWPRRNWASC
jgi:hypothetical protein